ncbi:unnamed protein product [Soboliphyme baturini]|uniref:Protein arginine N-methyltransferase 6 n=1 Tax=Soboliphyme baturini TaxID=241478 RepID=A0A183II14_9BILA|nr:unnamed protein product [Soboliphyme baturini]
MTRGVPILDLDLYTVQPGDLEDVQSEFQLKCFGHAMIHGFCMWFRVDFPGNEHLSTSPYDEPTHWRQSVLYVPPFAVSQDDEITGRVSLKRGASNYR